MGGVLLHGFGARYDLQGPLFLYLFAAAGVVVVSCVMVVLFAGDKLGREAVEYPRRRAIWLEGAANARWPRLLGGALGVLGLLAVIVSGLFGSQKPFYNPAEYLVWVYFWAATVILAGLAGNLWTLLNPWAAIHSLLRRGEGSEDRLARLGIWPAAATYFLFACLELTSGVANRPAVLASLPLAYSVFPLAGMLAFGPRSWPDPVACVTVYCPCLSRFDPLVARRPAAGRRRARSGAWGPATAGGGRRRR